MSTYKYFLVLVITLTLSACATGPTAIDGRNAPLTEIPEGQGIALVKMIGIARPSVFNPKWRSLILEDSTGKPFSLNDVGPPAAKYSLFLGSLPEGKYKVKQLASAGSGPGLLFVVMSTDSANIESRLPQFEVRKGAVTNLGTIVFQLPKGGDAKSLNFVMNNGEIGKRAVLDDLYPDDKTTIMSMPANHPSDNAAMDRIGETEALVFKSPPFLAGLFRLPDGKIAAPGVAGFLHIRERNGNWHAIHTNAFDTFNTLSEINNQTLALGTEGGKYYLIEPEKRTITSHRLTEPDLAISAIVPMGKFGYAIRAKRATSPNPFGPFISFILIKKDLNIDGTEKELISIDGFSVSETMPIYFHKKDLFVFFNEPGVMRTTKMWRFNMESGEKSQQGFDFWAFKVEPGAHDEMIMTRMNSMSFYRSISKDDGKTWQAIDDEIATEAYFFNDKVAVGLRKVSTGWDSIQAILSRTEDGGKTWKDSGVPFTVSVGKPQVVGLGSNEIVVYTGLDIRSSLDGGTTWKVEWPRE